MCISYLSHWGCLFFECKSSSLFDFPKQPPQTSPLVTNYLMMRNLHILRVTASGSTNSFFTLLEVPFLFPPHSLASAEPFPAGREWVKSSLSEPTDLPISLAAGKAPGHGRRNWNFRAWPSLPPVSVCVSRHLAGSDTR